MKHRYLSTALALALLAPASPITANTPHTLSESIQQSMAMPGAVILQTSIGDDGSVTQQITSIPETREQLIAKSLYTQGADTHRLTVTSKADAAGQNAVPNVIFVMKDTYMFWKSEGSATGSFDLPAGTYNIQVVYDDTYKSNVFFPDVELKGDMNIDVNADMADKVVSLKLMMPDNSPLTLADSDDSSFKANTTQIAWHQAMFVNNCGQYFHSITASSGGANTYRLFTVKSNLGPKTDVCWNALTWKTDFGNIGFSVTRHGDALKNGDVISNNVSDFYEIGAAFDRTPLYETKGNDNKVVQMCIDLCRADGSVLSGFGLNISEPSKYLICAPKMDTSTYFTLSRLQQYEAYPKYGRKLGVYTPPIANTDHGLTYLCNQENNACYDHLAPADTPQSSRAAAPFNPSFAYPFSAKYVMCSSTPYASTGAVPAISGDKEYNSFTVAAYYGNYGENRFVDTQYYSEEATFNGTPVDLSKFRDVNAWLAANAADAAHQNGNVTISFINTNAKTGGIESHNTCTISFKEGADDAIPPTVQRIRLSDTEGIPAIEFENADKCRLTIAGGDFSPKVNNIDFGAYSEKITSYTCTAASLKVEMAPNGTQQYSEVEMSAKADKYVECYGYLWEGALKEITTKSDNGWFDLRVTLTDKAGNSQVQTISPAFFIKNQTPSGRVDISDGTVRLIADNGRIIASDGSEVTVYTLSGCRVRNADLSAGIYVAVCGNVRSKIAIR